MFEKLTTKKISIWFFAAFLSGSLSIYFNFFSLYIPVSIVFFYFLLLFIAQKKYYISLTTENKNSPYILGFIFTLVSLLNLFINLNGNFIIDQSFSNFFIPQTGCALSTTIAGLIFRHLIISYDPAQETQDTIWRQATAELKENANAYREAQSKMLSLIDDFVTTHREILTHEQDASKQHLIMLNETNTSMKIFATEFPEHVSTTLSSFDEIQKKSDEFLNEILPRLFNKFSEENSFNIQKLNNDFMKVAKTAYTKMTNNLQGIEGKIDNFDKVFESTFQKFPALQQKIFEDSMDKIHKFQEETFSKFTINLDSIIKKFAKINSDLSVFNGSIDDVNYLIKEDINKSAKEIYNNFEALSSEVKGLNLSVAKTRNEFDAQNKSFEESLSQRMNSLQSELKQIDEIINVFIEVTNKRLN